MSFAKMPSRSKDLYEIWSDSEDSDFEDQPPWVNWRRLIATSTPEKRGAGACPEISRLPKAWPLTSGESFNISEDEDTWPESEEEPEKEVSPEVPPVYSDISEEEEDWWSLAVLDMSAIVQNLWEEPLSPPPPLIPISEAFSPMNRQGEDVETIDLCESVVYECEQVNIETIDLCDSLYTLPSLSSSVEVSQTELDEILNFLNSAV